MNDKLNNARAQVDKADNLLRISIVVFLVFMIASFGFISYQLATLQREFHEQELASDKKRQEETLAARARLNTTLKENAKQHVVTQKYIKCIVQLMLRPMEERTKEALEKCGIPGIDTTQSSNTQSVTGSGFSRVPGEYYSYGVPPILQKPASTPAHPGHTADNTPVEEETHTSSPPPDPEKDTTTLRVIPLVDGVLEFLGL